MKQGRSALERVAISHLRRADPVMAAVIEQFGPQSPHRGVRGFEGLGSAIIYQQVSGAAGDSIVRRLRASSGARRFPPAPWFLANDEAALQRCGLSRQKRAYLRDLAAHVQEGRLDLEGLRHRTDEEVLEALTEVKGIGRWTAEMYLLFALQRPDILPVDDLGIRKGVQHCYGFRSLPSGTTILRLGERWRPYRSFATNYLWRSLEREPWEGLRKAAVSVRGGPRRRSKAPIEIPTRP